MMQSIIEFRGRKDGGKFWVDFLVDRELRNTFGPFDSEKEQQDAIADMTAMSEDLGGSAMTNKPQ